MNKLHVPFIITIFAAFCIQAGCTRNQKQSSINTSVNLGTDWDSVFTSQGLLNVKDADSTIRVHLRYSTTDNFIGKDLYGSLEEAYLRPEALEMLQQASQLLQKDHPDLRLLIYDAARPRRIQQVLWDESGIPESERNQYVANPKQGSIHNYGCAVDLTLVYINGEQLDMGTGYDNFTPVAHTDQEQLLVEQHKLTQKQVANRRILRTVMSKAGFLPLSSEWWHFDAFPRSEITERFTIVE
jgi:D-alanyl-D-alanine dipeptidase